MATYMRAMREERWMVTTYMRIMRGEVDDGHLHEGYERRGGW